MSKTVKSRKLKSNIKNTIIILFIIGILASGFIILLNVYNKSSEDPNVLYIQSYGYDSNNNIFRIGWDNVINATKYHVYQSFDNIIFTEILTVWGGVRPITTITGLQEDSMYYFKVTSEDNNGTVSDFSNTLILDTSLVYNFPS